MTKYMQASRTQSRQAVNVRYCPKMKTEKYRNISGLFDADSVRGQ